MGGFDTDLSILENIKANGMLKGGGLGYYLEGMETVKFRLAGFKDKLAENDAFRDYFYALGKQLFENNMKTSNKLSAVSDVEETDEEIDE